MTDAGARTYFEDIAVDDERVSPAMTLTETHANLYRGLAGEPEGEPGLIPDLLPLCISTGLGWRTPRPPLVVLAFIGLEWQTVKPTRVGDTVHTRARTAVKRGVRDAGIVIEEHEMVNQHGEVVQRGRVSFLIAKRAHKETPHGV